MARYLLTPEAQHDLREIRGYIARRDSARAAARALRIIRIKLEELAESPGLGHKREDLTQRDLLFWPVYSCLIVYRPGTSPLEIVAIPSGFEDVAEILNRKPD